MRIQAIIETAVYVDGLRAAETFYGTALGLPVIGKEPGRHVFFQVGEASVLLAFLAEATPGGDLLPPHGATGPGHFALGIEAETGHAGGVGIAEWVVSEVVCCRYENRLRKGFGSSWRCKRSST